MILISPDKRSIVKIDKGELVSYKKDSEELIHQKGAAGWRNSDTEMFPVIGPTEANNYIVSTPKGNCFQDQHGILRELNYRQLKKNDTKVIFQKEYTANTKVKNSKFPKKSSKEIISWPYNFIFIKSFILTNESLNIAFEIEAEKGMPFMLGYHPAFKLSGDTSEICQTSSHKASIQNIMDGGSSAYPVLNTNEITLLKENGSNVCIKTAGFNNFMLWTEVPNMLCIEPITNYPYSEDKALSKNLFNISTGKEIFNVEIKPLNN